MKLDNIQIQNKNLPTWIVTISGWGDPNLEEGEKKMSAYKSIADKWGINIELSSRLGTLQSYKNAPSVAKEIMDHNQKAFAKYEAIFGKNWREQFSNEVNEILKSE